MREIRTSGLMWRTEAPEPLGPPPTLPFNSLSNAQEQVGRLVLKSPHEINPFPTLTSVATPFPQNFTL